MSRACPAAFALALAACGGDEARHATPTGRVAGQVLDYLQGTARSGVPVELRTGDSTIETETDEAGFFELDGVPAGSALWLDLAAAGYPRQRYTVALDDAAGQDPQDNSIDLARYYLYQGGFSLRVHVATGAGQPVQSVQVFTLSGATPGLPAGAPVAELPDRLQVTTDGNGDAVLEGVCYRCAYQVTIEPFTPAGGTGMFYAEPVAVAHDPFGANELDLIAREQGGEGEGEAEAEAEAEGEGACDGSGDVCCNESAGAGGPCKLPAKPGPDGQPPEQCQCLPFGCSWLAVDAAACGM